MCGWSASRPPAPCLSGKAASVPTEWAAAAVPQAPQGATRPAGTWRPRQPPRALQLPSTWPPGALQPPPRRTIQVKKAAVGSDVLFTGLQPGTYQAKVLPYGRLGYAPQLSPASNSVAVQPAAAAAGAGKSGAAAAATANKDGTAPAGAAPGHDRKMLYEHEGLAPRSSAQGARTSGPARRLRSRHML